MNRLFCTLLIVLLTTACGTDSSEVDAFDDTADRAERGGPARDFDAAFAAYRAGNSAVAYEGFSRFAAEGHAEAAYWLGHMYLRGSGADRGGAPQDDEAAYRAWRQAAEAGMARAQDWLAFAYRHGRGVEEDRAAAARWYLAAAEQGHASAMQSLGSHFAFGWGVDRDIAEAYRWYRASAEAGDGRGAHYLGRMYQYGDVPDAENPDEQAAHWFRVSGEAGFSGGSRSLGDAYRQGRGVPQDRVQAMRWYLVAESQGGGALQRRIAELNEEMTRAERRRVEAERDSWLD